MDQNVARGLENSAALKINIISLHDAVHHPAYRDTQTKERVMAELGRSELARGIVENIYNQHGSARSWGAAGAHRDDAKEAQAKQDVIDEYLRQLKGFNDKDQKVAYNLRTLEYVVGIEIDVLNKVLSDIKSSDGEQTDNINIIEGHKETFQEYQDTLQTLETKRKKARNIDDLINIEEKIDVITPNIASDLDSSRDARRAIKPEQPPKNDAPYNHSRSNGPDLDMGLELDMGSDESDEETLKKVLAQMKGLQEKLLDHGRITPQEARKLELLGRIAWRLGWRPSHGYDAPAPRL